MTANKLENIGVAHPCGAAEVDNFRYIGEVVSRKTHHIRLKTVQQRPVILMGFSLQINKLHVMPGVSRRTCHQFQPEWLQPEKNLGIHQGTGVNRQDFHDIPFLYGRPQTGMASTGLSEFLEPGS